MDENRARAIVADAVKAGLSGLAVETLLGPLAKKLGVTPALCAQVLEGDRGRDKG